MILRPDKELSDKKSYKPISLPPVTSKLFEKLFLKRSKSLLEKETVSLPPIWFQNKHSTVVEMHRMRVTERLLEEKKVAQLCS